MPRSSLAGVPLEQLQNEIVRRQKLLPKLIAQREKIDKCIAELQGLLAKPAPKAKAKAPAPRVRKRRRAKNKMSLAETLAGVLKGKQFMAVPEIVDAVLASGYKTTSKAFRALVNQTLIKNKQFKNAGRGKYALKA